MRHDPKHQIRSERPVVPTMGVDYIDENGRSEGRLCRDAFGRLYLLGRHGRTVWLGEEPFREWCREQSNRIDE